MLLASDNWILIVLDNTFKFFESMMNTMYGILSANPVTYMDGDIWKVITAINSALMGSSISLMLIFFYTGLFEDSAEMIKHKNSGYIIWSFIKLFLLAGIIIGSSWFLLLIFAAGGELMTDVSKVTLSGGDGGITNIAGEIGASPAEGTQTTTWITEGGWLQISPILRRTINSLSFKDSIIPFVITLIAAVVILASTISIVLMVYGRFFTLAMHMAIAPLPFACLAGKSTSQHFFAFIKSFIGVVLEAIIILVAILLFAAFARSHNAFGDIGDEEEIEMINEYNVILDDHLKLEAEFNPLSLLGMTSYTAELDEEGEREMAEFKEKYGLLNLSDADFYSYMEALNSRVSTDMLYKYLLQLILMFLVMAGTVKGADEFIKRRLAL